MDSLHRELAWFHLSMFFFSCTVVKLSVLVSAESRRDRHHCGDDPADIDGVRSALEVHL